MNTDYVKWWLYMIITFVVFVFENIYRFCENDQKFKLVVFIGHNKQIN